MAVARRKYHIDCAKNGSSLGGAETFPRLICDSAAYHPLSLSICMNSLFTYCSKEVATNITMSISRLHSPCKEIYSRL